MKMMYSHINPKNGAKAPLLADDVYEIIAAVSKLRTPPNIQPPQLFIMLSA